MNEKPGKKISLKVHYAGDHELTTQEELADLAETPMHQIAAEIGRGKTEGQVPLKTGGYVDWHLTIE